ncbi:MAG: PP2C family protein-serine/threonine phosphatase [Acidobacteria bacterium]|nr:PP2C family protein-serine/threonine phosphatase [Acidobacteriota bacterium]
MPRRPVSLFRRIERALETIANASTPLETIRQTAQFLVESFSDDLGITGGRIYARDDFGNYELVGTFGTVTRAPLGLRIPTDYHPFERLYDEGCVSMSLSDTGLDASLESEIGTRDHFAAIMVADRRYALSFDVAPASSAQEDLIAILNIVRLAINQKLREERMYEILEEARRIQESILPSRIPKYEGFDMAARTIPAEVVGGDFYDFITLTDMTVNVVIADATGHGLPAALQVRDVYTGLRMGLSREFKITRTLERLNSIIHRSRLATKFVSLFLAELQVGGGVVYCNAGHPPGLLVRKTGTIEELSTGGMILGPMPDSRYCFDLFHMAPGDFFVLYTDGITEAHHPGNDEEFSVARLEKLVGGLGDMPASKIIGTIFDAVSSFSENRPLEDDQTVVVVRRTGDTRGGT